MNAFNKPNPIVIDVDKWDLKTFVRFLQRLRLAFAIEKLIVSVDAILDKY